MDEITFVISKHHKDVLNCKGEEKYMQAFID